jgi:hypothetical protein
MRTACLMFLIACGPAGGGGQYDGGPGDGKKGTKDAPADSGSSFVSDLHFAIVGDTRPPSVDDVSAYPTSIITKIWQDVEATSPHPQFAIATGDYMFASTSGSKQQTQLNLYMTARAAYTGPMYPAMGNHECTGATDSNCGSGNADGTTANYSAFISTMLSPISQTKPYYSEQITAPDNSWTAKIVVVACNAWSSTQASWLDTELAKTTTYTFVVRHEGTDALVSTPTPPCGESQTIIAAHPLTLLIVGHTHKYAHYASDKEVVVGNGGAPLTNTVNYGYVLVTRNASGTLTGTAHDYMTNALLDSFTVSADGSSL